MNYIGKTIEDEEHGRGVIVAETATTVLAASDDSPVVLLTINKDELTASSSPCSWCGTENDLTPAAQLLPVFCLQCGHRADVPKIQCDCGECLEGRGLGERDGAEVDVLTHGAQPGG